MGCPGSQGLNWRSGRRVYLPCIVYRRMWTQVTRRRYPIWRSKTLPHQSKSGRMARSRSAAVQSHKTSVYRNRPRSEMGHKVLCASLPEDISCERRAVHISLGVRHDKSLGCGWTTKARGPSAVALRKKRTRREEKCPEPCRSPIK